MDDWNDFGTMQPGSPGSFASSPDPPYAESSRSTLDTFSDSSAALLDASSHLSSSRNRLVAGARHGEPNPSATGSSPLEPSLQRSSFLSSIPFLSTARQRRADRTAAAAAAALAEAHANAAISPNANPTPVANTHQSNTVSNASLTQGRTIRDSNDDEHQSVQGGGSSPIINMNKPCNHDPLPVIADEVGEGLSASSGSDDIEPRSVMMDRPTRRTGHDPFGEDGGLMNETNSDNDPNEDNNISPSARYSLRRGDLDDVPDDYELNIEGFRFTALKTPNSLSETDVEPGSSKIASCLLRPHEKSYIKLEVISAKQIRSLLQFFFSFLALSVVYTLFFLIVSNTIYKKTQSIPLPAALLTQEQMQNGFNYPSTARRSSPQSSLPRKRSFRDRRKYDYCPCRSSDVEVTIASTSPSDLLYSVGLCNLRSGLVRVPTCKHEAKYQSRQGPPIPPGGPPQPPMSSPPDGDPQDSSSPAVSGPPQFLVPVAFVLLPAGMKAAHLLFAIILSVFFLVLAVLFLIRLIKTKRRNITHEQIWVFILLLMTFFYFDIVENVMDAYQTISLAIRTDSSVEFPDWLQKTSDVIESVRVAAFTGFAFFYLWANLHSYRILESSKRLGFVSFYLPKIAILVPFVAFQIISQRVLLFEFSEVPLLTAPVLAFIFGPYRMTSYLKIETIFAILKTLWDFLLMLIIFFEASKTMRVLEQAPYMKYRAKRIGFRFFLYINFVFYSCFIVLYWLALFGRPVGDILIRVAMPSNRVRAGLAWSHKTGSWFLIVGYVLCTAYVHLPYTCVGWFAGWFRSSTLALSGSQWSSTLSEKSVERGKSEPPSVETSVRKPGQSERSPDESWVDDAAKPLAVAIQNRNRLEDMQNHSAHSTPIVDDDAELQQQIVEPITYRKRESKDSLELKANCFTMQTHVIMFNFAWYVYYYGTPKLEKFRPKENPLPFEFVVDGHVISDATDTQALVLDCTDRIIVTFKGTTSMKNLRTSLRVNPTWLRTVVRLNADAEDESMRLRKLFGVNYLKAKIHQGFATAYTSVVDEVVDRVRRLRDKKLRPVFLTGHSLGGALATICSLDLWVKLNISRREIFVSTFGSPRVGNTYFAAMYKEVVPLHWRIVVDPDMIARLPRVGYVHVGKKVVLTPHGEMIIDPTALEHRPWSGEAAGFAYHRKASYLLAMRAWCVRNHGMTYTPVFWPFPVRPEDERRFAGAFEHDDDDGKPAGRKVAQKIIRMDAMVDALGSGDNDLADSAAVEKWARLTRRILLNEKLGGVASI